MLGSADATKIVILCINRCGGHRSSVEAGKCAGKLFKVKQLKFLQFSKHCQKEGVELSP